MALLLISRGSFSGGIFISRCLSEMVGWKCLTREDLVAVVNTYSDLANKVSASISNASHDYAKFSSLRRPYKILTQMALLKYALAGDVAYFGYAGHLLVPDIPHAVRVRILAPIDRRVSLLRDLEQLTHEEARERIRQVDLERSRWTRFMYGQSLRDPEQFDLCLNLDRISFKAASSILINATQQEPFIPTPESMAILRRRYLGAQILAALVADPRTSEIEVSAATENDPIFLEGPYLDTPERAAILEVARTIPGAEDIQYREGYAPSFELLS